jgi:hypothetical protein
MKGTSGSKLIENLIYVHWKSTQLWKKLEKMGHEIGKEE